MNSTVSQPEPTATVIVAVMPTGEAGTIALSVIVDGPAKLSLTETVFLLRSAADTISEYPNAWQQVQP